MNVWIAIIVGVLVAIALALFLSLRARGRRNVRLDPIAATTGSNRTLTGAVPEGALAQTSWNEALRYFAAYALDDVPREELSKAPNPEHAPVFAAVARQLERIEAHPEYIPRRPNLLPKLLATVNNPESSMEEIAGIIAQDPALTGNLLRIANSPLYRVGSTPIESIDRAVTLVGVLGIRSIIVIALLQPVMVAGPGAYARFPELVWEHTLYAAMASELHATQVENAEPFVSQLIGLLFGLSAIVVFRIVRDQFNAHPHLHPDPGSVARLLESWVAPTAGRIAASWELSDRVQVALESQALAMELRMENSLGRSLKFGRVAASLLVLCRLGRMTEAEARAILLANEPRNSRLVQVWERMAATCLRPPAGS
jgi:HD-like signal output (HDOD) protein